MSRYDWPAAGRGGTGDRALLRAAYRARLLAAVSPEVVRQASEEAGRASTAGPMVGQAARAAPTDAPNLWVPIGPSVVLNGQAGSRPRVAGRVRDLAVHTDGRRAYAASASGGVWFTSDAGTTWAPVGGWATTPGATGLHFQANTLACGCLLVHFGASADGRDDVVYVGTGEIRGDPYHGIPGGHAGGIGVLRLAVPTPEAIRGTSERAWQREGPELAGKRIYRLAFDPRQLPTPDPTQHLSLVAATSGGLFMRRAGGAFVEGGPWDRVGGVPNGPLDFVPEDRAWTTDVAWVARAGGTRLWVAVVRDPRAVGKPNVRTDLFYSDNGTAGPFQRVTQPPAGGGGGAPALGLPDVVPGGRLGLAVAPSDASVVYALARTDYAAHSTPRLWRVDGTTARRVANVPGSLFGRDRESDQSDYDLALAVSPDDPAGLVFGGSVMSADGESSAALFRCQVVGTPPAGPYALDFAAANQPRLFGNEAERSRPTRDVTYVGHGVHADVHAIRFGGEVVTPSGFRSRQVWVACDGGVFRSDRGGAQHSFVARNDGLAVLEIGYVASHPTSAALALAGTQDNGVLLRTGDTVWEPVALGDGGGVLFHPSAPHHLAGQSTQARWFGSGHFRGPAPQRGENRDALFYSGADAIAVTGTHGAPQRRARLAIGTDRVWLSESWDPDQPGQMRWVTLPSGVDPEAGKPAPDRDVPRNVAGAQFAGGVVACRWAGPSGNHLFVLYSPDRDRSGILGGVFVFRRGAGGRWQRTLVSGQPPPSVGGFTNAMITPPVAPLDYLPPLGSWSDIAVHNPASGAHGSCYVAATGHSEVIGDAVVESSNMDTLWWFDGNATWHRCGLRTPPGTPTSGTGPGTKAPAYAVVCDPDNRPDRPELPSAVYVGTAVGVWKGVLSLAAAVPTWDWTTPPLTNGLPEGIVHDLSLHAPRPGTTKLLRAAIQARGVWELDLSAVPSPTRRTYLRAHRFDARRDAPAHPANPIDPVHPTRRPGPDAVLPWHASPDMRIRPVPPALRDPALPPRPAGLPWLGPSPDAFDLWRFQTALHAVDPSVRPTGLWTPMFERRLRNYREEHALGDQNAVSADVWDHVWRAALWPPGTATELVPPWDGIEPTEADLMELVHERLFERDLGAAGTPATALYDAQPGRHLVHVLVHHRDSRGVEPEHVLVTLLRRDLTPPLDGDGGAIPLDDGWRRWAEALVTDPFALPGGVPPAPAEWRLASGAATTRPSAPVDARTPRPVTFTVDLGGLVAPATVLLLAVVSRSSPVPPLRAHEEELRGSNVRALVLNSHRVAARLIGVR